MHNYNSCKGSLLQQTEKLMAIVAKLPESSRARKRLTDILIKGLWDGLDHPPMSFHGPQYQYRTADGSYNVGHSRMVTALAFHD